MKHIATSCRLRSGQGQIIDAHRDERFWPNYQARITVQKGDQSEDAACVLGLLLLAASQGMPLTLSATGPEAELAVQAIVELFEDPGEGPQVL
jgi:phosphotransferase system HPr (HPr) family protein